MNNQNQNRKAWAALVSDETHQPIGRRPFRSYTSHKWVKYCSIWSQMKLASHIFQNMAKLLLFKLFLNCFFLLHFQIILHCILDCHWQLFMKQEIASHSPAPASVLKARATQGWFYEWNNYSLILSLLATFLPLLALITMKHFATTYQAVNTADLGKVGCALPQQRTSGQLPKEANEFSSSTVWEGWGWF